MNIRQTHRFHTDFGKSIRMQYSPDMSVIVFSILALLASYALTAQSIRHIHDGFKDQSNERSLHLGAIPKIGGITMFPVIATLVIAKFFWDKTWAQPEHSTAMVSRLCFIWLTCALPVYATCLVNDRSASELSPFARLFGYVLAAGVFVYSLSWLAPGGVEGLGKTVFLSVHPLEISQYVSVNASIYMMIFLSTLTFVNFYNFMDGIDGLAGSMSVIGFSALGWAGWAASTDPGKVLSSSCALIVLSNLSFLRWNWPNAKIFLGDTGSTFLGFSAVTLGWIGSALNSWHWSLPFLIFFPFWFDATLTLVRRTFRREKVWKAHREHLYQRAVLGLQARRKVKQHRSVLYASLCLMVASSLVALDRHISWLNGKEAPIWTVLLLGSAHVVAMIWADYLYRSHRKLQNQNFSNGASAS